MKIMDIISDKVKAKINKIIQDGNRDKELKDKAKIIEEEEYWKEKEAFYMLKAKKNAKTRAKGQNNNNLGLNFNKKNIDKFMEKLTG